MASRFHNPDPTHRPHGLAAVFRWGIWDRLTGRRRVAPPGAPAPRVPAAAAVRAPGGRPRLTWIGHASFLGSLGGAAFLVDPVFGGRLAGLYRRFQAPGLAPGELPRLAAVLVSHNHYDHFDAAFLAGLPRDTVITVPLGLGRWFRRRGFRRVAELGWWEQAVAGALRITLVPARHWSRRGLADTNRSLWGGFVVEGGGTAVYHAGDSAWFDGFAEIGRRHPDLAAAVLPIGAYAPGWFMEPHHLTPEQAGEAFLALRARRLVPMHWGTFQLTDEPLAEPAARLAAWWERQGPRDGRRLCRLAVGETAFLDAEGSRSGPVPSPAAPRGAGGEG